MDLAFPGALIIGLSLGLLGSGGSVLTVPVLIYLLQRPEKEAIAESLAIVGSIAMISAIPYAIRSQIHWKSVFLFGLPGMVGSCVGGTCSFYVAGTVQLTIFACLMIVISIVMIFGPASYQASNRYEQPNWLTILEGFFLGCFTGFIGIGGGFLIVPALVFLTGITMVNAVGTSLAIITMNALVGFIQQSYALKALHLHVEWNAIAFISIAGIIGGIAGGFLGKEMSPLNLRKVFGVSVLVLGCMILIKPYIGHAA